MHRYVLFEDDGFVDLLPLVYWRSVFELRYGRKLLIDRAAERLGAPIGGVWTRAGLAKVAAQRCAVPANAPADGRTVLVNGRWIMDEGVKFPPGPCAGIVESDDGSDGEVAYVVCDDALASRIEPGDLLDAERRAAVLADLPRERVGGRHVRFVWDFVTRLGDALRGDWSADDASIDSEVDKRCTLEPRGSVHVGYNTHIHPTAVIDATDGPVYISDDVRVGAYCVVHGPAYIGPGTRLNPHAWLHGGNSIGPVCRVGGELDGCVLMGCCNKQHTGFLGHSFVGSWVNLGAGTSNSDLKNTYGKVRVPVNGREVETGETFIGTMIGDHAKTCINATLPTGSVLGLAAVVVTSRVTPKFVPSFGWVTDDGVKAGDPGKLLDVASAVMARRHVDMTDDEVELFLELDALARTFEKQIRHKSQA
ncbi:MAG: putative sugar nucleotidyl transferase [Phycisphaerae bacterium]